MANPNSLPIGIQLFMVREDMKKDFEGTLRKIAEIGFREIESAGRSGGGQSVKQIADFGKSVGLSLRSTHVSVPELQSGADKVFQDAHDAGVEYVVCAAPWARDPSRFKPLDPSDPLIKKYGPAAPFINMLHNLNLDDWKWMVDFFNEIGANAKAAGLTFAYHNHNFEFKKLDGVVPYDLLIEKTDPQSLSFELDCGWMVNAGLDPVDYLTRHGDRYRLLHIKDLAKGQAPGGEKTTEVGSGTIDWKRIFETAKKTKVGGYYIEQEPPFDRPPLESAQISYDYLHKLTT